MNDDLPQGLSYTNPNADTDLPAGLSLAPPAAKTEEPVGFTGAVARGFKRSLPETKSLLYGAGAAVAGALGADGLRDSALENYQRIQREEVEPLANQQSFKRSLSGDGSFAEWAGDVVGNFSGQALQSAAIGAAGAAVGGGAGAPAGGVGAAPGAVIGGVAGTVGSVVARGAIKKAITESVEKLVADQVKKGVGREAAEAAGRVALQRKLQQTGGAALTTAALNTGQEIGIGYTGRATDAAEAGEELTRKDALRAIGWGIPAGLLDTASEAVLAGRAVKGGKATQGLTRRVLSGAGKGAATEGATEGAQAVMERAGAAQALTGTEAYDDYLENVAAGALGGGVMGGGSSIRRSLDPASPAANGEQTQGQDQTQRALPAPGPITVDPFGNAETPDQAYAREQALRNPTNDPSIIDGEFTEVPPAAPPGQLALPPPGGLDNTIDVGPDGTAVPANVAPLQDEVTAANVQARTRLGLTPDVNAARARHPAAIPNALPDGTPLPDPTNGVLSRVVNQAHGDGTLMEAAVQQAEASLQAQADAQAPAIEKAQQEQAAAQEKATKEATAAAEKKAADALKPASNSMAPAYRDQLKSLLHDSADMDSLPDSKTIEKTYGLKPREADELRREVIIERRTIANEATRNVAAAAGPDAQGAVAAGGMDNGGDAVGAADVPGGPAGQAVETAAAAPQANVARAPNAPLSYDDDHDVLDTDITPPSGGPFTSKGAADLQAGRFKDAKTVSVYGGFVVRVPKGAALEPAPKAVVGQAQPVPAATTPAVTAPAAATPPTAQVAPAQPQAAAATAPQSVPDTGPPQAKTRVVKGKREYIETAPETLAAYYLPGELVPSYGGGQDRVVSFHPAENGKNWSVKVQAVDKQGNPLPGEDGLVRKHRTLPSQKELVKILGPAQAPSRANRVIGAKPKAKRKVVKTDKLGKPMDLLQVLAGSGLDRDQWAKYAGVDPSQFTQKVGFNYLFRKRKPSEPDVPVGMTPNDVREMMQQEGYLPADDPNLPPTVDDNDAIDLVMRALNGGEKIYSEDQAEAVARYAEQEEAANAEYEAAQKAAAGFEDWMEASPESEEEVSYDQLLDRAFELGATEAELNDAVMGGTPAMQQLVTRLESEDGRRAVEEAQGDAAQEIVGEGQDQGAAGGRLEEGRPDAADEEAAVPGFQLATEAITEPAASSPKPAQSGLFAAPTAKDLVDDAQRRRDAERDGKSGTGRTDMAGGDGELFAGPRPEQASMPERQRITRDAAENMQAGDIVVDGQGNEYRAQRARHDLLVAHPIVNGKAQVSADTEVRFLLTPEKASSYPERRADPIYATGRNVNDTPATNENQVTRVLGLENGQSISAIANEAATSTKNDLPHPTEAQKEAGNYKKGHLSINGLNISLENPAGSRRRPEWPPLKNHYGYFKGSIGADKDHVDVFLSDQAGDASLPVFVVDQRHKNGRFDEHKVMLGFADEAAARAAYLSNYDKGWTGLKAITPMSLDDFKAWLADPAKTKVEAAVKAPREDAITAPALQLGASVKIEDFGERLEGARKFLPPSLKEELGDDQIATLPLSKVWPSDAHEGIEDPMAAALTYAARQQIPAKPRTAYKVKRWVQTVKQFRSLVQMLGEKSMDWLVGVAEKNGSKGLVQEFFPKVRLLAQLPRETWSRVEKVGEYPNFKRMKTTEELAADGIVLEVRQDASRYHEYFRVDKKTGERTKLGTFDNDPLFTTWPHSAVTLDGKTYTFDGAIIGPDEVQKVKELLGTEAPSKDGPKAKDFEIRVPRTSKEAFINRKGDSKYRRLKTFTGDDAVKEARAYITNNVADLAAAWEKVKARDNVGKGDVRREENRERVGENRRDGKDVTEPMFEKAFGFRGVQFGNWVGQGKGARDRQGLLNDAYDSLLDLSDLLGIPSRAISLEGALGLSLGARGAGRSAAHFEPSNLVINLTKTRGAGSLAHEWFHAMDNYFARKRGGEVPFNGDQKHYRENNYITYKPEPMLRSTMGFGEKTAAEVARLRERSPTASAYKPENWTTSPNHKEGVRPVVEKAFAELVAALNASPMAKRASDIDGLKTRGGIISGDGYWSRIIERGARSFENYVITKMAQRGWTNDFLANIRDWEQWQQTGKNAERYPYLRPDEEGPVVEAFDQLFATVQTRENDEGGVALFSQPDARTGTPQFKKWFGKSVMVDADGNPMVLYHGTNANFDTFDADAISEGNGNSDWGDGFYFTDTRAAAEGYADGESGRVLQVFLRIENPATNAVMDSDEVQAVLDDGMGFRSIQEVLADMGHDGIVYTHAGGELEVVVFKPDQIKSADQNNGEFNGADASILASRADRSLGNHIAALKAGTTTAPMTKAQATNATIGITSKWGASAPKVVIVENGEGLPEWVKSNPGYRTAEGLYDDANGTVYLVASNIKAGFDSTLGRKVTARERAQMVLVHESVGHYGIEAITGPALWAELESTIDRMRQTGKHADIFAEIDRRYRGANRSIALRETIAVMAEKGIKNSVLDRVIAAMRKFLRGLGFDLRFSDSELRQHIVAAARYVKDGARPREARNASSEEAFASRPDSDMKKQVQVVNILDGVFGDPAAELKAVRKRARDYLRKIRDTGRAITNEDTKWKIGLSGQSIGELTNFDPGKLNMLLALPRITRFAVLANSTSPRQLTEGKGRSSERAFHTFYAPVMMNNEMRVARLVVREDVNGNFAYDLQQSEIQEKKNPASAGNPAIASGARQKTGFSGSADPARGPSNIKGAPQKVNPTMTIAQLRDMVNSVDRPGWLWSQRGSVRIDGRGQRFVEQGGETFVQRGEQWYLAGKNGRPQDFLTRAAAQAAADRTGGQLEADPNEGARRTWSVILPNGMELSRATLFSQPDAEANEGQGLRDRMNARARAALDVVDRVAGGKKEFPAHWDAAQKEAAAKFATFAPKEKLSQRFDKLKSRAADTLVQRIFDQFRPLQRLSPEAFMQAHLSKATDGALEASFEHGLPVLKDGAFAIQEKDGGLRGIMAKLKGEHDQFLMWMVGNRAERLKAEGREQLFTDDDIRAMKRMNQGAMADGTLRRDAYRQAMQDVNRYNKAFLDIAEKAGVVNAEARKVWEDEFYVPFYREMEKGPDLGPGQANGLLRQRVIERLVGGTDVMGDPLENMMANWSHMLTASMRNMAANKALDQAVLGGFAKPLEAPTKESVWTMRDGKKVDWQVDDKMVLEALESLNFDGYDNPLMRTAGKFKRALTIGVTASPSFRIRNMVRDSLAALGTAEVGYNPIQNMVNGWKSTAKDSDTQINLMAGGGAVRFGSFNDGDQAANAKRLIAMGVADNQILDTPAKVKNAFRRLIDGWQEVGDRAETINRAVIYDRAIAAGKTHLQASFEARDLMNFTSMGSSAAVRALAQILPFFNARLQGVDRLGRGAKANPQRFAAVAGVLAMASAALFLLNKDDDDYKALPDYVRDTYWPIKLGGKWVYLPKPFEIGALGTIVERATELATAGDDYQARDFGNTLLSVLSSQLAMNPVPQIARPLTEAAFNYDMFRGAPIDSLSQQRLLPEDRFTARTAAPAVAAGQALGVSPQKIEHVLTGYFGWLGIQALNVGDLLSRSALGLPSSPSQDLSKANNLFVIGDFVKEAGSTSSKYVTRFYDMQRDIDAVYASANQARKAGDTDRTAQLLADPRLRMRPMFRNADNQITKINQQIRATTNNPTLSAAEKGKRLENLQAQRNLIAERIDAAARAAGF